MSLNYKDKTAYREDERSGHKSLDAERREYMIQVRYVYASLFITIFWSK